MKKTSVLIVLLFVMSYGQIGRVTTAGWTTTDWQFNGPVYTRCRVVLTEGIHVCWVGPRYNFFDFTPHTWNWQSGINPATIMSSLGGMDSDPINGVEDICLSSLNGPYIAKDQMPGIGIFEYCNGPAGYDGGPIGITNNQAIHITMDGYYARIQPWCNWTTPIIIITGGYIGYNIAASKTSNKVIILWVSPEVTGQDRAFYRVSNDNGNTWGTPTQLPFPPSQGFVPSFHSSSLFAMFDNQDNLHIVASVAETSRIIPAEIWHWCPVNPQPWTLIQHYDAETYAPVGYNALFATRPSIVQNPTSGYFYVSWEQFDSLNYEPTTNLARADIWVAELRNNGQTLYAKRRITNPNTTSKRYPIAGGVFADTFVVNYLIDSIAGFENYIQGRTTNNPAVCQFIPIPFPGAEVEEQPTHNTIRFALEATPNPFISHTAIHYLLPAESNVLLSIYDATGRLIKILVSDAKPIGEHSIIWNGQDNRGIRVKNGIYFSTLTTNGKSITNKIIKAN